MSEYGKVIVVMTKNRLKVAEAECARLRKLHADAILDDQVRVEFINHFYDEFTLTQYVMMADIYVIVKYNHYEKAVLRRFKEQYIQQGGCVENITSVPVVLT